MSLLFLLPSFSKDVTVFSRALSLSLSTDSLTRSAICSPVHHLCLRLLCCRGNM